MAKEAARSRRPPPHKAPLRARAKAFAFEGVPEKDRFGIFDPALRGFFVFGVMLAAALGIGLIFNAAGDTGAARALSIGLVALLAVGGFLGYRRIWRRPGEKELLLTMAAEDDEARALRAKLARSGAERDSPSGAPDGKGPVE